MSQSKRMSAIESLVTTIATGSAATAANYFVLPLWGFHPDVTASVAMAVFFGALSFAVKYPIRRGFNRGTLSESRPRKTVCGPRRLAIVTSIIQREAFNGMSGFRANGIAKLVIQSLDRFDKRKA